MPPINEFETLKDHEARIRLCESERVSKEDFKELQKLVQALHSKVLILSAVCMGAGFVGSAGIPALMKLAGG